VDLRARKVNLERLFELPVLEQADRLGRGAGALLVVQEQPLLLLLLGVKQVVKRKVKLIGDADSRVH